MAGAARAAADVLALVWAGSQVGPGGIYFFFCPNSLCLIPQIQPVMLRLCPIMPKVMPAYSAWPYGQVTKLLRMGTSLAVAPYADKSMNWLVDKKLVPNYQVRRCRLNL